MAANHFTIYNNRVLAQYLAAKMPEVQVEIVRFKDGCMAYRFYMNEQQAQVYAEEFLRLEPLLQRYDKAGRRLRSQHIQNWPFDLGR